MKPCHKQSAITTHLLLINKQTKKVTPILSIYCYIKCFWTYTGFTCSISLIHFTIKTTIQL